jgi:lipopolysaccharide transport system permease protein
MVIQPTRGWRALDLREVWRHRELLYFLAWRDVKVRYKQTALGAVWTLLQPLLAMAVFWVVLGHFAGMPSDGVPYPIFALVGLLPWLYFAGAVSSASGSLVANASLVSKVYFPRLIVPLAAVAPGLVDLAIGLLVLFALMASFGLFPGVSALLLPLFVLLALVTAFAVGVWLSALDVRYRDIRYTVPFLVQMWLFATPVLYPSSLVPGRFHALYGLNPMAGVVEGFRWALLGRAAPSAAIMAVSALVVTALLLSGLFYFRRVERVFADVI